MTPALTAASARRLRAAAQLLLGERERDPVRVLDRILTVQAQDATAAALGLRARAADARLSDVARAVGTDRTVVRGWFLRGTLHLVPAADVRWLLALLGPVFLAASRRRCAELGLDEPLLSRADALVSDAVAERPRTRAELAGLLTAAGVPAAGQAAFHLIRRNALAGRICQGPVRDGEPAYVALDDWVPGPGPGWDREEAAARLAGRYLAAHAPASLADFVHWSGLPAAVARAAWRTLDTVEVTVDGKPYALPAERADEIAAAGRAGGPGDVRLLPAYDDYLVGWRDRTLAVPPGRERAVWPGGGQIRPAVVVDGRVVGTWWRTGGEVGTTFFEPPSEPVGEAVGTEAADVARFLAE
ncbi:winged helix DNA-binding domain-containing protein [Thermobifida alba]|uniref:Winged helix DNA-binding domain-containing protein n=1 Tax=Thermobifida alba TaxID=53522 RepID=A0ABY4L3S4_THEAE|nr:winged helix DNA-binding domain-containing protein [Thermobifida alba]UPT22317.1 winged helix DNA-binding domain-containing protein [Thermobifida alba]